MNFVERKPRKGDMGFAPYGEEFSHLIESVPHGIIIVDTAGVIVQCNSEAEKMFHFAKGELLGRPIEDLVPARFRAAHPGYRENFAKTPSKRQMGAGRDLTGVCRDGVEIPVEIGLNHITNRYGTFIVASVVDITARKNIENELRDAYSAVRMKNEEME